MFFYSFRISFFLTLFWGLSLFSQGGDLLIQQYSKGPELNQMYSKWSLSLGPEINRINTDLKTTSPTITIGAVLNVEYRFSKTVSLVSGLNFMPISYTYPLADSLGRDRLEYLTVPLFLKLHPTEKISLGLGALYNRYQKGERIVVFEESEISTLYREDIFSNSFGFSAQLVFHFWKRFHTSLTYRWAKKSSAPTLAQSNNSKGLQVGLTYTFFESLKIQ
ncbi:MAG: hypothetical protein ACI9TK_000086 [Flavobacteriaceae bacterium]|jgi:hypothetical protein|tara:strand:- start:525 stop:1184 length:660 start_codon:yes stop_codon:yes gene_type:complete